tara:strand:+ start:7746 stop:8744 length:999 start_codon:yes stop_codon:yes gene_type:complete
LILLIYYLKKLGLKMLKDRCSPPVLFLVFNRPALTQKVFNVIQKVKPKKLFIAADGPRDGNYDDINNCKKVREISNQVDWECEVTTLYRERNLGCRVAITSAINWFFESVDEGIILEDDCLPSESFFSFSQELLEKYRLDDRVMQINGNFHLDGLKFFSESYYFSKLNSCWGWATWKKSWSHFDSKMDGYEDIKKHDGIKMYFENKAIASWMTSYLNEAIMPSCGIWSTQWAYAIMKNNGLCVNPTKNMVNNIGFFETPTSGFHESFSIYSNYKLDDINHIKHPELVSYDVTNDELEFINVIKKSDPRLIHSKLRLYLSRVKSKLLSYIFGS